MNNLPVMPNSTASLTQRLSKADSQNSVDVTQELAQPFGSMLARQLKETTLRPDIAAAFLNGEEAKQKDTLSADIAALFTPDAPSLPNEMLAALMPQVMERNTAALPESEASAKAIDNAGKFPSPDLPIPAVTTKTQETSTTLPPSFVLPRPQELLSEEAGSLISVKPQLAATELPPAPVAQSPLSPVALTQNLSTVPVNAPQLTLTTPVTHEHWGNELGQTITWMAGSRTEQSASLHLNPPQLGPLDVVVKVSGDQASAFFTSPHAAVREAVESALPKLREMMADNGIMLGNATVSDQSPRDFQQHPPQRSAGDARGVAVDSTPASTAPVRVTALSRHHGTVDTFA